MGHLLLVSLLVLQVFLLLPVSSDNLPINGTVGTALLWRCHYKEPFDYTQTNIFWQGKDCNNSDVVLHVCANGKEELQYQAELFENRTKIFLDQLPSGNLSLIIERLILEHDQTGLEVVVISGAKPRTLCETMLYVAAPFQEPQIKVNLKEMTATCSTHGGYPEPEVTWSSVDHQGEHILQPLEQPTVIKEKDGTYSVSSTTTIRGSVSVTCSIYNPTSNQTVKSTKDLTPDKPPGFLSGGVHITICIVAAPVFILIVIITVCALCKCLTSRRHQHSIHTSEQTDDSPGDLLHLEGGTSHHSNSGKSPLSDGISAGQVGDFTTVLCKHRKGVSIQ